MFRFRLSFFQGTERERKRRGGSVKIVLGPVKEFTWMLMEWRENFSGIRYREAVIAKVT